MLYTSIFHLCRFESRRRYKVLCNINRWSRRFVTSEIGLENYKRRYGVCDRAFNGTVGSESRYDDRKGAGGVVPVRIQGTHGAVVGE
jgi:hypothetical protein